MQSECLLPRMRAKANLQNNTSIYLRKRLAPAVRGRLVTFAASNNGNSPFKGSKKYGENLDDRIASGEFDDSGSTKEKLTRPLRKILAKDPLGPGMQSDSKSSNNPSFCIYNHIHIFNHIIFSQCTSLLTHIPLRSCYRLPTRPDWSAMEKNRS